jgi:hypothetical protein
LSICGLLEVCLDFGGWEVVDPASVVKEKCRHDAYVMALFGCSTTEHILQGLGEGMLDVFLVFLIWERQAAWDSWWRRYWIFLALLHADLLDARGINFSILVYSGACCGGSLSSL